MDFTIVGICKDDTQTFRKGASKAPDLIREIFPKMETYINGVDLSEHFIEDLGNVDDISSIEFKGFPIILGGEHSITEGVVDKLKPKNIVVFDAHPDLENKDGHTGVFRRLKEKGYNIFLYGIRIFSKDEEKFMKENNIKICPLDDLKSLEDVYLSIDLDVLDPSIMPAVGNPEPDGLTFSEVMEAVKVLAPNLKGVDIVEYTPLESDNDIYLSVVGKLIYRIMTSIIKSKQA